VCPRPGSTAVVSSKPPGRSAAGISVIRRGRRSSNPGPESGGSMPSRRSVRAELASSVGSDSQPRPSIGCGSPRRAHGSGGAASGSPPGPSPSWRRSPTRGGTGRTIHTRHRRTATRALTRTAGDRAHQEAAASGGCVHRSPTRAGHRGTTRPCQVTHGCAAASVRCTTSRADFAAPHGRLSRFRPRAGPGPMAGHQRATDGHMGAQPSIGCGSPRTGTKERLRRTTYGAAHARPPRVARPPKIHAGSASPPCLSPSRRRPLDAGGAGRQPHPAPLHGHPVVPGLGGRAHRVTGVEADGLVHRISQMCENVGTLCRRCARTSAEPDQVGDAELT
jgi:hypothetical protein